MDVLEYWKPEIDWIAFKQGTISDAIWESFRELVQLCHAFRYWQQSEKSLRGVPRSRDKLIMQDNRKMLENATNNKLRAAYLASDRMAKISNELSSKLDGSLYMRLRIAVDYRQPYERRLWDVLAFDSFDAEQELRKPAEEVVDSWILAAGHSLN